MSTANIHKAEAFRFGFFSLSGKMPFFSALSVLSGALPSSMAGAAGRRIRSDNSQGDGIVNTYPAALFWLLRLINWKLSILTNDFNV